MVLDFTSSLYLGYRHPVESLRPWDSMTTGKPAALAEPGLGSRVAEALANLQGCERGVLAPSTLHLFWDLFGIISQKPIAIYLDAGTYPIARWGVERATARGVPVQQFSHHEPQALLQALAQQKTDRQPVIVTDGFCPACGRVAPIKSYLAAARDYGGLLIIDDTQALGIFGQRPGPAAPYGSGGGGVVPWSGVWQDPQLLVVSSLAKGFGVSLAALCGSEQLIRLFAERSETRVHCSQPATPLVNAAFNALRMNAGIGEARRRRLAGLVGRFCRLVTTAGFTAIGGLFPFQTLAPIAGVAADALHGLLLHHGVNTVLHRRAPGKPPLLSVIISASHQPDDIDQLVNRLRRCVSAIAAKRIEHYPGTLPGPISLANEDYSHDHRLPLSLR